MLPRIRGIVLVTLACLLDFTIAGSFTVDDADPAIAYSTGNWNIGNTCTACFAQPPNHSLINDQTWHDATRGANSSEIWFQYTFTGTSLTVYGILIDIVRTEYLFTTNVDLTLNIDGQTSSYTYTPVSRESYQYQIPVFAQQGLSNTAHTMRVTLNPSSAFLFDYLVYTTPDTSTSSISTSASVSSVPTLVSTSTSTSTSTSINSPTLSSSSATSLPALGSLSLSTNNFGSVYTISSGIALSSSGSSSTISIGAIIGIVAGVVALLLIIIAILLFLLFRKRRQSRKYLGPQSLPISAAMNDDYGVSEPFMQSVGPTTFLNTVSSHGASTSEVLLNSTSATAPYASSGNLNSSSSPNGGAGEAVGIASGATTSMNSKQRRLQEDHALLPAQQLQQRHHIPAWLSRGKSAYSESTGIGASVYSGMENVSSHTGPMTSSSGNTDHDDSSGSTLLSRSAAPGVGGRIAPWNAGLYPHGIPAPVQLAAPVPVPLGLPLSQSQTESSYSGRGSEGRSRSAASGVTAPPPYIRSPPPLDADHGERVGRILEGISEYTEKR